MLSTSTLPRCLSLVVVTAVLAACTSDGALQPIPAGAEVARTASSAGASDEAAIITLRRATVRYKDVQAAIGDGFVLLHPCESRPGEGAVGTVYVHMGRLLDGVLDPTSPEALIYEPGRGGRLTLVGAEFAIPYGLWTGPAAPALFGATFQPEDEFGVYALHAWVWRNNPDGLFAETNSRVSC